MTHSKYQIHAELRRVFARRWIDLERIHFGAHRGIVRVSGELHHTRIESWDASLSIIEVLHADIMRIKDVQRVYFDFDNWERDEQGKWNRREPRKPEPVEEEEAGPAVYEATGTTAVPEGAE